MSRNLIRGGALVASASMALALTGTVAAAQTPADPGSDINAAIAARTETRAGTISVTTLSNSGRGSLRTAIKAANSRRTATTISFAVSGTIVLSSKLPNISKQVTIDGATAPGYAGTPVVEVNANRHGGIRFANGSSGSRLIAISIVNASGNGVTIDSSRVTLARNYIGLTAAGAAKGNFGDGVYLAPGSSRARIGLNPNHKVGLVSNVISANRGAGLRMIRSSKNVVVANRIGTNPAGSAAIGNRHGGIEITAGSSRNKIGGNVTGVGVDGPNNPTGTEQSVTPVFVVPPMGNLVSGNKRNGVLIDTGSANNILSGNFVGTNADGTSGIGNKRDGVRIIGSHNNVLRGCTVTDNPFVYYNVISGNGGNGIHVTNSNNTVVQANFVGIGAQNDTIVANGGDGMLFDGNSQNPHVGGVIPLGNVAAGNRRHGIEVKDTVSGFLTFNTFGGLYAFLGAAPNGGDGLRITSSGGNQLVRTNVWSGNAHNGVALLGKAHDVTVSPNVIGLSTNGSSPLPNRTNGILIGGKAHDNLIGGYRKGQIGKKGKFSVIPQNTVSGNLGRGLVITGSAHHNRVIHSYFGVSTVPWFPLPAGGNLKGGVLISSKAHDNVIGVANNQPFNLISNNTGNGVTLTKNTRRNGLVRNYIGLSRAGTPLPNTGMAVADRGKLNYIIGGSIKSISH